MLVYWLVTTITVYGIFSFEAKEAMMAREKLEILGRSVPVGCQEGWVVKVVPGHQDHEDRPEFRD